MTGILARNPLINPHWSSKVVESLLRWPVVSSRFYLWQHLRTIPDLKCIGKNLLSLARQTGGQNIACATYQHIVNLKLEFFLQLKEIDLDNAHRVYDFLVLCVAVYYGALFSFSHTSKMYLWWERRHKKRKQCTGTRVKWTVQTFCCLNCPNLGSCTQILLKTWNL